MINLDSKAKKYARLPNPAAYASFLSKRTFWWYFAKCLETTCWKMIFSLYSGISEVSLEQVWDDPYQKTTSTEFWTNTKVNGSPINFPDAGTSSYKLKSIHTSCGQSSMSMDPNCFSGAFCSLVWRLCAGQLKCMA